MRHRRVPRSSLVVCLLAIAAGSSLLSAPPASATVAGVQTHLLWGSASSAEMERQLDLARDGGARIVRVDAGWASFEPSGKGQYNAWYLDRMDRVVTLAEARGLKVLFTIWETPCWASSAPDDMKAGCTGEWWSRGVQRYMPTRVADYGDALAFLVRRYGTRVAYQVWNEPNDPSYLKSADPVRDYAALLRAAYPMAKAANGSVKIVGGSLAHADFAFTDQLYAQGIKGHFDAWSVHPYSEDRSPLHPGYAGWERGSFATGVPLVRDVMLKHGDDKPLWLTEFGWTTTTTRGSRYAWLNGVDPEAQARFVREALEQVAKWPYVEVLSYFNLKDTSSDPASHVGNFGLLEHDYSQKPAYAAFREAAARLHAGTTSGGGTTTSPPDGGGETAPAPSDETSGGGSTDAPSTDTPTATKPGKTRRRPKGEVLAFNSTGEEVATRTEVAPRRARAGRRTRFRFVVTATSADGSTRALAGAVLRFAGRRLRTDATGRGVLTVTLRRPGLHAVRLSLPGGDRGAARVRVKGPR